MGGTLNILLPVSPSSIALTAVVLAAAAPVFGRVIILLGDAPTVAGTLNQAAMT